MAKLPDTKAEVNQPAVAFLALWRAEHPGQPDPHWAQGFAAPAAPSAPRAPEQLGLHGNAGELQNLRIQGRELGRLELEAGAHETPCFVGSAKTAVAAAPVAGAGYSGRGKARRIAEAAQRRRRQRARELRNLRSDQARQRKFRAWAERWGGEPLRCIPRALWVTCVAILADPSGSCARAALAATGNKVFAGLVRAAARVRLDDGAYLYAWGDYRARATVAVAMCLNGCARRVRGRRRRWKFLCDGITRSALAALLTDPHTGARPSITYLTGTYGFGGRWNAQPHGRGAAPGVGCGILTALRQVGALYASQWEGQRFATPSGYQPNQYWLVTDRPDDGQAEPDDGAALWEAEQGERCAERDDEHEPPGPYTLAAPAPCARPP